MSRAERAERTERAESAGPPQRLPISPPLLGWLRAHQSWQQVPLARRAALHWASMWGGINLRLSEARQRQQPAPPVPAPLFVLGAWRSGTTVLHELIVAASGRAAPRTWQCMDPTAFRLHAAPPDTRISIARPMDGLQVASGSPQEDEFALLGLGVASAYRAFLMPQRIDELHGTLDAQAWCDDGAWLPAWERFLQAVVGSSARGPVLKSPNHSWRMRALRRRWPQAQAVWIVRDPAQVLASNRKMWRAMFSAYALVAADDSAFAALDRFLLHALDRAAAALSECAATMPREQFVVVTHEALLAEPEATVRALLQRLDAQAAVDAVALASAMRLSASGRVERYNVSAADAAEPALQALAAAQATAVASHGL